MTYISQHIMSFVWVVVWAFAIGLTYDAIVNLVYGEDRNSNWWLAFPLLWAIIIVFWFN